MAYDAAPGRHLTLVGAANPLEPIDGRYEDTHYLIEAAEMARKVDVGPVLYRLITVTSPSGEELDYMQQYRAATA